MTAMAFAHHLTLLYDSNPLIQLLLLGDPLTHHAFY
jgi:hypothetical protein